jgi:hypothetical protein
MMTKARACVAHAGAAQQGDEFRPALMDDRACRSVEGIQSRDRDRDSLERGNASAEIVLQQAFDDREQ